jgi:glutamate--cysteine ligase
MSKDLSVSCPERPLQYHDLTSFVGLPKTQKRHCIGLELEKIPVRLPDFGPLAATDGQGLQELLDFLVGRGWLAESDEGRIVALRRGGQKLEFSTGPAERVDELLNQEREHLAEIEPWCRAAGIGWCGIGLHPLLGPDEISGWMKPRYRAMWEYFGSLDKSLGHWMMKATASIQVAMDFDHAADLALKVNVAARLIPILTALFANAPIRQGREAGWLSFRAEIWRRTDPDRCGLPDCFFDWNFEAADYVRYALDAPMIFVYRDGRCHRTDERLSFRRFLDQGWSGTSPCEEDWDLHLSMLFPDIRLRHYLEFRCFDRQQGLLTYSAPALLKALLYSPEMLRFWARRLQNVSATECRAAMAEAASRGLSGELVGRPIGDWAAELTESLRLNVQSRADFTPFERERIDEIAARVRDRRGAPAEELLARYRAAQNQEEWLRATRLDLSAATL